MLKRPSIPNFLLSESYHNEYSIACQWMVLCLGRLPELPDFDQKVLFLERLNELIKEKIAPTEQY